MSENDNQVRSALVTVGNKTLAVRSATLVKRGLALAESLQPGDAAAHLNLGNALYSKGDMDGAIAEYRTAIRLQADDAAAHYNLGLALEMKGDRLAALDEIEIARKLDPNHSSIAEAYERIRRKAGRHG
jgi:tetratricopeptide (TPR) repeat protein